MIDTSNSIKVRKFQQSNHKVILLLALVCSFTSVNPQGVTGCATNCYTCFGPAATQCTSCINGKVLQNNACVNSCSTGYTADTRDSICKRTQVNTDYPCPPGTFNQATSSSLYTACTACLPGKYCESYALASIQDNCVAGHYCTSTSTLRSPVAAYQGGANAAFFNASIAQGDVCPQGSYCQTGSTVPKLCDGGYYCSDAHKIALDTSKTCQAGYYCTSGAVSPTPNGPFTTLVSGTVDSTGNICPFGRFCATGTTNPSVCSAGSYLSYTGAILATECISCTPGQYCASTGMQNPNGDCTAGFYCGLGSTSATQQQCNQDYYCPQGTLSMIWCPQGQYTSGTGQPSCLTCSAGKLCRGTGTENNCPNGYYCTGDIQYPCPQGTYMPTLSGQSSVSACLSCQAGQLCQTPNYYGSCAQGFYCTGGAKTGVPNSVSSQAGGMCVPGQYCPAGSTTPTLCPVGFYCQNYGLSQQTDQCSGGYYCPTLGSATPTNTICPTGAYCTPGSSTYTLCPVGTYSMSQGATDSSTCLPCPSGIFCNSPGQATIPTANSCTAGYFCDTKSTIATQTSCSKGYMCPAGSAYQQVCPTGTYQPLTQQATCDPCPAGYYCDGTDSSQAIICPRGYYCPTGVLVGTKYSNQYPCPAGTFGALTGLSAASQCTSCSGGYYCQFKAQSSQTTQILAGYHANNIAGQVIPNPYICPQAMYCPTGTQMAFMCPNGYWTAWQGAQAASECITCPRGMWCKFGDMANDAAFQSVMANNGATGASWTLSWLKTNYPSLLATYYGNCNNGYICLEGATSATPTVASNTGGYPCPVGYYCVAGVTIETPCAPGTYNPTTQQAACLPCEAGKYCPNFGMTAGITCLAGYYCPGGNIYPFPCATGSYSTATGLSAQSQCTNCPATKYCDGVGQLQPTDQCQSGFICTGADARKAPYATDYQAASVSNGNVATSGKCPAGTYCVTGQATPSACPATQYAMTKQNTACLTCPPGFYCTGGIVDKIQCTQGYFCTEKSAIPAPTTAATGGGICPAQHYCVTGTSQPLMCQDGQIQNKTGQFECVVCDSGYTCLAGVQTLCPAFHVCNNTEAKSYPYGKLCLGGTYATASQLGFQSYDNCAACPPTQFCSAGRIVSKCAAGYICIKGADAHKPNITNLAYACPYGYWCSEGAQTPVRCPLGTFTMNQAAKQISECTQCQPGYFCPSDFVQPQPCNPGGYCPYDSSAPIPCPKGTFQPINGTVATSVSNCLGCLGGYYCNQTGLGNILSFGNQYLCPLGNYCPAGDGLKPIPCLAGTFIDNQTSSNRGTTILADSINSCQFCPKDYYCVKGTNNRFAQPCPDGFICPAASGDVTPCPPGFYCQFVNGAVQVLQCPQGSYCPMGTAIPKKCQPSDFCPAGSSSAIAAGQTAQDCKPGQYLFINKCKACEPGFVCDKWTNQKYPIKIDTEGGTECPAGFYCPEGSTTATAKPCPVGTYNFNTGGKSISDCLQCNENSANNLTGQAQCIICGSGSTSNQNRTLCQCQGAFRNWQFSTNTCPCQTGFKEPVITSENQNSALKLDCQPILQPPCPSGSFINEENKCVPQSWCQNYAKCGTTGGVFDALLNGCFCNNQPSNPSLYCDSNCQKNSLKAFLTKDGQILLQTGDVNMTFPASAFGSSISLDGQNCPIALCAIQNVFTDEKGNQVTSQEAAAPFVKVWKQRNPSYQSPYGENQTSRMLTEHQLRKLSGSGPQPIQSSIKCIKPYDSISFQVSQQHFPVYITQSIYNTNPKYDYGAFTNLETKLVNSNLAITSFMNVFSQEGVFVFGDYAQPYQYQTIVLVTSDADTLCKGQSSFPITSQNMQELGISANKPVLKSYDSWLHIIPPFFVLVAFLTIYAQSVIEKRIEARELEVRLKREGASLNMKKYFKKAQDKFDKLEYLADLYKLIDENLDAIHKKISENDRLTEEENRDNMNKMLADKYSLLTHLRKGKGDQDLEDIRTNLTGILNNLRFQDGRSLEDLYKEFQQQQLEKEEQARLDAADKLAAEEDRDYDDEHLEVQIQPDQNRDIELEVPEELKDDVSTQEIMADPNLYDDLLKAKEQMKLNRAKFIEQLDKSLSDQERQVIMNRFDDQMREMERQLLKEQEDQAKAFKAKLANRNKLHQHIVEVVKEDTKHENDKIQDLQRQIEDLHMERDEIEEVGINSRGLKKERETELKLRMAELDKESDSRLAQMRQDYMDRIKEKSDPKEKEKILQEMGKRLKATEESLAEDRKRQEANLMKLLRARQKKNLKQKVKEINKEADKLYTQVDEFKSKIDEHKAKVFAEQGIGSNSGLVNEEIALKRDRILGLATQTQGKDAIFHSELTKEEQGDLDIQKAQLDILKEKELKAIEVQVEEELDSQIRLDKQRREEERNALQQKINSTTNQEERDALLAQLAANDKSMQREIEEEKRNQAVMFDQRKRRKADRMQIRKMRIEMDQLSEIAEKELALNNKKFNQQLDSMDLVANAQLTAEVKTFMRPDQKNKEQCLILISETNDELLQKKLKLLSSKQFFDLSKLLNTLQQQVALDQMIKIKEIHLRFDQMKEIAQKEKSGTTLDDQLLKIQAERDLEVQFVDEQIEKSLAERESLLKQKQEQVFCKERKDIIQKQSQQKSAQIGAIVAKYPNEKTLQEVGVKLLKRIQMSLDQEIAELEKEKEEKIERARLKIIAENEDELQIMQDNLNQAMAKEEASMNQQLEQRKLEIMQIKKANLDERMKLATTEMTDEQIANLRKQYENEFDNLETAIQDEKQQQLLKMRAAMVQRRIDKERKRKQKEREIEEARRREAVHRMNAGMAKVFREFIAKKTAEVNAEKSLAMAKGTNQLKAKLQAWSKKVDHERVERGGEDAEVWNLKTQQEEEKEKVSGNPQTLLLEKKPSISQGEQAINQLFVRVLKVERLLEKVKEKNQLGASGADDARHSIKF